jgi:hypothetical protein
MTRRRFALAFLLASIVALAAASRGPAALAPANTGLQLRLVTGMAERLTVAPVGIAAEGPAAEGVLGRITLTAKTVHPVMLQVRALPSVHDLDDVVQASVTVDGMPVGRTTLGRLRAGTVPFRLLGGRSARLGVRLWLPAGTPQSAYVGPTLDVVLELHTEPVITR